MSLSIVTIAAILSLSGVQQADARHHEHEEVAAENPLAGMTFEVVGEPGLNRTYFAPDWSYTDYQDGDIVGGGTYDLREDGQLCFTDGDSGEVTCWMTDDSPDDDGWMSSVRTSDGLEIRVRPVDPRLVPED